MLFSEAILNYLEAKIDKASFMIALYPSKESIDKLIKYQKSIHDIKNSDKVLGPEELHVTLRYSPQSKFKDKDAFIKWLKKAEIDKKLIKATFKNISLLGKDKAYVLELQSKTLNDLQKYIDEGFQSCGAPCSDYPNYKAHISLAYGFNGIPSKNPPFDHIYLNEIRFVDNDDKIYWSYKLDN